MLPALHAMLACTARPSIEPAPLPSLLLVTLDTTRADRIGAYGYAAARTPTIDRLASQGIRFERAYATVPLTTPSHASIMTGLYPPRHGIRNNGDAILSEDALTLAEHLKTQGYRTAASVSAFVTTRLWNLDQGFDAYFDTLESARPGNRWGQERPAGPVADDLIAWLPEASGPFFAWAHFYDPHAPYTPPPPHDADGIDPYDGELAYVDAQLGRLLAVAEAAAGPGGLAVIVVADHGEALSREHGEAQHGMFVFDPTMRVPFVIRPPAPLGDAVVQQDLTASIVDVAPTALGLLGLAPMADIDGQDLSGALPSSRTVYMESMTPQQRFGFHPEVAVAEGGYKLIDTPSPLLFNTGTDPEEAHNLILEPDQAERVAALRAVARETWARQSLTSAEEVAPEVLDQLTALGYVNNGFQHSGSATVDAKEQVQLIIRLEELRLSQAQQRNPQAAEAGFRALLETYPDLAEARMGLARALGAQGRSAESEAVYRQALALQPSSTVLRANLAQALGAQGRHEEGLAEMLTVLEQVPGDNIAQLGVLRMLTDLGRIDEGIRYGRKWLEASPDDLGLKAHLGVLYAKQDNLSAAMPLLQDSLQDNIPRQLVHQILGNIAVLNGQTEVALAHFRQEQLLFFQPELYDQTARLLFSMQRWAESVDDFAVYLEAYPEDLVARRQMAQAVYNTYDFESAAAILAPALAVLPDDPDVLLLHANILAKIGDLDEARKVADRANQLHQERLERSGLVIPPEPASGTP